MKSPNTTPIKNEEEYEVIMVKIDHLMAKGSDNVSTEELTAIRSLALAAQAYERGKFGMEKITS